MDEPSHENGFLTAHAMLLLSSFRRYLGRDLLETLADHPSAAERLYHAPFAVLSHDNREDPVLNYVNMYVMDLWESDWNTLTAMPSRLTAEPMHRAQRTRFLSETAACGYIDQYQGIRVLTSGKRFRIEDAIIWNVVSPAGERFGQAATFENHAPL